MKEKSIKRIGKHSITLNIKKNKLNDNFISSGTEIEDKNAVVA